MIYKSTRGASPDISITKAIIKGIADDGGLYVPESFPRLEKSWEELGRLSYTQLAAEVLKPYLDGFTDEEIMDCVDKAYTGRFEAEEIVPVKKAAGAYFEELYHGPTAAFKDMALSLMPRLLTASVKKEGENNTLVILVSTSGDTGMAALKGFQDVPGTQTIVFFPDGAVSPVQERQMRTAEGKNSHAFSIFGNFDDAQTAQKAILNDSIFKAEMAEKGFSFTAANSMNIGRLIPQIVYYVWGYLRMVEDGAVNAGEAVNIVVPSGNFGNILSAYYAFKMGVPVNRFICASNKNKVLTDFFNSGIYDAGRKLYVTNAPSMDIIISSNLERLLYHFSGEDGKYISGLMNQLKQNKKYSVNEKIMEGLSIFTGEYASEEEVIGEIGRIYKEDNYLMDTHTAVASCAYRKYTKESGDNTPALIASTASPFKFVSSVSKAIGISEAEDPFLSLVNLSEKTGLKVPEGLRNLDKRPVLHSGAIAKENIKETIKETLNGISFE